MKPRFKQGDTIALKHDPMWQLSIFGIDRYHKEYVGILRHYLNKVRLKADYYFEDLDDKCVLVPQIIEPRIVVLA